MTEPQMARRNKVRHFCFKLTFLALLLGTALIAPRGAWGQTTSRTPVSAVVISVSVTIWPAIVAQKKGFFASEGLDFDFINSGSSARSLQQVAAGSAPIGAVLSILSAAPPTAR